MNLTTLCIAGTYIDLMTLQHLPRLKNLKIDCVNPSIFPVLRSLESLTLGANIPFATDYANVSQCSNLKRLKFAHGWHNDRIPDLTLLTNLRTLLVGNMKTSGTVCIIKVPTNVERICVHDYNDLCNFAADSTDSPRRAYLKIKRNLPKDLSSVDLRFCITHFHPNDFCLDCRFIDDWRACIPRLQGLTIAVNDVKDSWTKIGKLEGLQSLTVLWRCYQHFDHNRCLFPASLKYLRIEGVIHTKVKKCEKRLSEMLPSAQIVVITK
jgi:hypothetical protein